MKKKLTAMDTHGELAYSAEAEARDARFALGRL